MEEEKKGIDVLGLVEKLSNYAHKDVDKNYEEYNGKRDLRSTQSGKRTKETDKGELKEINKASVPFCRDIVKSAVAYLLGHPPTLKSSEENDASTEISRIWKKNRMEAKLVKFAETVKSEGISALVFYLNPENEIKARVLGYEDGQLYPYFDEFGDLKAFGWEYKEGKGQKMHLFTSDAISILQKNEGWKLIEQKPNPFGKIPVVFLEQKEVEWHSVKWAIDRYEVLLSIQADINNEFGSPKYKIIGKVNKDKEDPRAIHLDIVETKDGKIIHGDVDIISAPQATAAIKLEIEELISIIYEQTQTVRANFESVKGIGNISNTAMELMYQPAIIKARFAEADYEVVIDRCLHVIKAGLSYTVPKLKTQIEELTYDVQFNSILPKTDDDKIKLIMEALTLGAISTKTAIRLNPLIENKEEEYELLQAEKANQLGETYEIE